MLEDQFEHQLACKLASAEPLHTRWMGAALLPQAGVGLGMKLTASHQFPTWVETALAITIGATAFLKFSAPCRLCWLSA